jgi:hypothetical protein
VCRLLLVGILIKIDADPDYKAELLTTRQKQILKAQIPRFLGSLSVTEFARAVESIKTYSDKAKEAWNKFAGPIATLLRIVSRKTGLDPIEVPAHIVDEAKRDDSMMFHFRSLLEIAQALDFSSTYLLVDKVDESALTLSDATKTFQLIRPLLLDLPTLETPNVAFKFFLWDRIGDLYSPLGRPDRIPIYRLDWSVDELEHMLSERIFVYSSGALTSFNDVLHPDVDVNIHKLICYLAQGSPRDMIRLAKRIIDEQTRTTPDAVLVEDHAVWHGIRAFAAARAEELFSPFLSDLRRIGRPSFSTDHLGRAYVPGGAKRRLNDWIEAGVVDRLEDQRLRGKIVYALTDLRVLIEIHSTTDPRAVLNTFTVECPRCRRLWITGEEQIECSCGEGILVPEAKTLIDICLRG